MECLILVRKMLCDNRIFADFKKCKHGLCFILSTKSRRHLIFLNTDLCSLTLSALRQLEDKSSLIPLLVQLFVTLSNSYSPLTPSCTKTEFLLLKIHIAKY